MIGYRHQTVCLFVRMVYVMLWIAAKVNDTSYSKSVWTTE